MFVDLFLYVVYSLDDFFVINLKGLYPVAVLMDVSYISFVSSSVFSPNSQPIPLPMKLIGADFPLNADTIEPAATTPTATVAGPIDLLQTILTFKNIFKTF